MNDSTLTYQQSPGFFFPILKPAEIQSCLLEMGISIEVNMDLLTDPAHHKEKLREVFTFLLECCASKTEEDFCGSTPALRAALSQLPHADQLHPPESTTELRYYAALRDLMESCGYDCFSWRDLYAPVRKRLQHQLSAVINLAKFREDQLKLYNELNDNRQQLIFKLDAVNEEHNQLQAALEEKQIQSKHYYHELENVLRECDELEEEIQRQNKLQAAAREEAAAFKKQLNDLKDAVSTAQWALEQAEAEEEALRGQVVSSPDRRKSERVLRQERLQKVKQECAAVEAEVQTTKTKVVHAKKAVQDLEATLALLEDLHDEVRKHQETLRQMDETRKQCTVTAKQTSELNKQMEEAQRRLKRAQDKIEQQSKQHQMQLTAVTDALGDAKERLLRVERDRRDGMARVEAGEQKVRALEALMAQDSQETDFKVQSVVQEYKQVETAFLERNEKRMNAVVSQCGNRNGGKENV